MFTPPQALTADRLQTALTRRFLLPALPALEVTFLTLRAEADAVLSSGARIRRGKPYPYGYCLEITTEVARNFRARVSEGRSAGERALKAFLDKGGRGKVIWGALRGRYFQNAIQLGSFYVDVSNDTVDPRKPKVEILPMAESGMEQIRDAAHFARIAELYWDVRAYANTILPSLAPLFPIVIVDGEGRTSLQARMNYMMRLFGSDGFSRAEQWLREAPAAPEAIVRAFRAACPEDVLAASPRVGAAAGVEACRRLRAGETLIDAAWMDRMVALFDRAPIQVTVSPRMASGVADVRWSNARPTAGIETLAA